MSRHMPHLSQEYCSKRLDLRAWGYPERAEHLGAFLSACVAESQSLNSA
ncbi:hypothetical protein Psch_02522 [Pelotomaculum schinkii]|uniref:Uncharacterized protein n=1 Tax=Pelotomaculum schinkii TaxID=78350 RepID=A0A4Y7R9Z9_9FIRM|nr:hypothetical protein Psch_02522 [Pelotomaculum schinkii]